MWGGYGIAKIASFLSCFGWCKLKILVAGTVDPENDAVSGGLGSQGGKIAALLRRSSVECFSCGMFVVS